MTGKRQPREQQVAPDAAADALRSSAELRRRAEELLDGLSAAAASASPAPEELAAAVHELRVHQIELEMQNEELRRAQEALEAQREKYFELFDLAPVGYLTLSEKGIVGEANFTAAQLLGVERRLLVGRPFGAFVFAADGDAYYLHLHTVEQSDAPQTCELRLQRVGAEPFWAHLESRPQHAAGGEPLRYHLTFADVNERARAAEALRDSEERFRALVEWTPEAIVVHRGEKLIYVNPAAVTMFGAASAHDLVGKPILDLIHPDCRQIVLARVKKGLDDHRPAPLTELRYLKLDGTVIEAEVQGTPIVYDGEPAIHVALRDVTARKQAEKALRQSEEQLASAVEGSGVGLWDWQVQTGNLTLNERWTEIIGYTLAELAPISIETWRRLSQPDDLRRSDELLEAHFSGRTDSYSCEVRMRHKDGHWVWVLDRGKVSEWDGDWLPSRMVGTHLDISERKLAEEALACLNDKLVAETTALAEANATITRIAATDHLTGLANRRHFYNALEKAASLARRHGSPLALLSLDLDGLKQVNDSAGHKAGDEVLAIFAALLAELCRVEDVPARLGGDEFCVLLPGMELGGAQGLAERVLAAVRACAALAQRRVTVSAGVAQWAPDELPDDLLRRADVALYAAKRLGGDAVADGD